MSKVQKPTKKYICSFCARPFSRSEHKLRHERSHTNTKPFNCTNCSSSFVRRDLMQRHLRTVHKIDLKAANLNTASADNDAVPSSAATAVVTHPDHTDPKPSVHHETHHLQTITKDVHEITQLLTLSKSHQNLQISLESQVSTLFFLYGTSNIPIHIDEETIYAALCYGASFINANDCLKLFHKALTFPNLKSLSILAWTYLLNHETLCKNLIPIEVIFNQLDTLLCSLKSFDDSEFMWFINGVQAQYVLKFNKQPPLSYSNIFLHEKIEGKSLTEWLKILSKSSNLLPLDPNDLKILLDCLIMELQNLKFNSVNSNDKLTKIESHNSIIMFNKFYISKLIQFGNLYDESTATSKNTQFSKIFMISKRNLLLNVPQSFQDLIVDYVLIPYDSTHINLLHLTLREFQYWNSIQPLALSTSPSEVSYFNSLINWFNDLNIYTINNNLGLISYPLIVLGSLPLSLSNFNKDENFKDLVLEVFLILIKIFNNWRNHQIEGLKDNVVLKGVIFLLLEMSNESEQHHGLNYNNIEELLSKNTLKTTIVDKLFKILKNWLNYYDIKKNSDLNKLRNVLLNVESSGNSSPIAHSPLFKDNILVTQQTRNSSISSISDDNFSIITSPPSGMKTELNLNPSNYTYFPTNYETKIKLPPLNIPIQQQSQQPAASAVELPFVSIAQHFST